jgi:hypothetical protein
MFCEHVEAAVGTEGGDAAGFGDVGGAAPVPVTAADDDHGHGRDATSTP